MSFENAESCQVLIETERKILKEYYVWLCRLVGCTVGTPYPLHMLNKPLFNTTLLF